MLTGNGRCVAIARWLLLAAVIAGVVAMHVLSAGDSGGSHQAMAAAMAVSSAEAPAEADPSTSSPSMVMDMPVDGRQLPPVRPVSGTQSIAAGGVGMSPMSCCVLFLVSAVGLVLLVRSYGARTAAGSERSADQAAPRSKLQRGPPGSGRRRITLSVLRV